MSESVTRGELVRIEEQLNALRRELEIQLSHRDATLVLQAGEYGRRLEELNHAHVQAVREQARTVPRELFDQYRDTQQKSYDEKFARIEVLITTVRGGNASIINRREGLQTGWNWAVGVVAVILAVLAVVTGLIKLFSP